MSTGACQLDDNGGQDPGRITLCPSYNHEVHSVIKIRGQQAGKKSECDMEYAIRTENANKHWI